MIFHCCHHRLPLKKRALILGILNVTPDSFSDGGVCFSREQAVTRGLQLLAEGADILDIGGESTRPGALAISAEEEMRRVLPVIQELHKLVESPISIDTSKAVVAQAAIEAGASIINDISALTDPEMATVAASTGAGLILMHMQGTPRTMQIAPTYTNDDVVTAVTDFLSCALTKAITKGISRESIILDPGIGFGKRRDHNFSLINAIPQLTQLGAPLLIGHSRKSFLEPVSVKITTPVFKIAATHHRVSWEEARFLSSESPKGDLSGSVRGNRQGTDDTQQPSVHRVLDGTNTDTTQRIAIEDNHEARFSARLIPSIALTSIARYHGAMLFRVHDPRPHREALEAIEVLLS